MDSIYSKFSQLSSLSMHFCLDREYVHALSQGPAMAAEAVPLTLSKIFPHVPIIIRHMLSNNVSIFFYHLNPLLNVENPALFCCGLRPPPRQPRWPAARLWTYSVHYMCPFIGDFHTAAARKTGKGGRAGELISISISSLCPLRRHVVLNQTFSARQREGRDGKGLEVLKLCTQSE